MVDSDVANAECKAMRYVPLSVALNKTWEAAHDSCNLWISARSWIFERKKENEDVFDDNKAEKEPLVDKDERWQ